MYEKLIARLRKHYRELTEMDGGECFEIEMIRESINALEKHDKEITSLQIRFDASNALLSDSYKRERVLKEALLSNQEVARAALIRSA